MRLKNGDPKKLPCLFCEKSAKVISLHSNRDGTGDSWAYARCKNHSGDHGDLDEVHDLISKNPSKAILLSKEEHDSLTKFSPEPEPETAARRILSVIAQHFDIRGLSQEEAKAYIKNFANNSFCVVCNSKDVVSTALYMDRDNSKDYFYSVCKEHTPESVKIDVKIKIGEPENGITAATADIDSPTSLIVEMKVKKGDFKNLFLVPDTYYPTEMSFVAFMELAKGGLFLNGRERKQAKFTESSQKKFLETVPFIFLPNDVSEIDETDEPLDLPYPTCFFEMLGKPINVTDTKDGFNAKCVGIWINELSPKNYEVLSLFLTGRDHVIVFDDTEEYQLFLLGAIRSLLKRMSKEEVGFNNPRKFVKAKIGSEKINHRINKIVYVCPKRMVDAARNHSSREIDWSHQWSVRGHWRQILGKIGRDRDENPCVGYTWVRPHVRGPDGAPLIQKKYLVGST